MEPSKLRRQIAWEAARLMYQRQESEYFRAKTKAAQRLCRGWTKPKDLPSNTEIRDAVQAMARMHEGDERTARLRDMRVAALAMMQRLAPFRPRLIGSVLTGHIRQGSDIDLHVFSDSVEAVIAAVAADGLTPDVERKRVRKRVRKQGEERTYTHIHVRDRFPFELTVYGSAEAHYVFKSSITGKAIERASVAELREFLEREYPHLDLDAALAEDAEQVDRYAVLEALLLPLEDVRQDLRYRPEGDALYHSLQVFDRAQEQLPYDEEFLEAALLHDVGKAIDARDHVAAGLEALDGLITDRTAWLIEQHMLVHRIIDGSLGQRAHRRLRECEWYDDLILLGECDRAGRVAGAQASELDEAIDYLREISDCYG
ncbi:MAG: tRNA adenylyltransferase [Planctomycetaceae bacterium]|nr:tRNA adenylyltransferase [Planctomycetaceae bacterium]